MSLLATKLFIKKSWLWLKTYWYFPLAFFYTVLMYIIFRKDGSAAVGALDIKSDSFKAQIKTIDAIHKAEKDEKEKINKKFIETLDKVDVELKKNNEKLDRTKKKRVKEIVEEHSQDPEKLAELVKESFGFEIME